MCSLLIFCSDDLSLVHGGGVLKSPTIIVLLLCLLVFALCIEVSLCWVIHIYSYYIIFLDWPFDYYVLSFFVSYDITYFKVYFVWNKDCHSSFLLVPIHMEYLFPSCHSQSVCVSRSKVGLLQSANIWILFLYPFSQSVSFG